MRNLFLVLASMACMKKGQTWETSDERSSSSLSTEGMRLDPSKAVALFILALDPAAAFRPSGFMKSAVTGLRPQAAAQDSIRMQQRQGLQIGRIILDACNLGITLQSQPSGPPTVNADVQLPGLVSLAQALDVTEPIVVYFDGRCDMSGAGSEWTHTGTGWTLGVSYTIKYTEAHENADDCIVQDVISSFVPRTLQTISAEEAVDLYENGELPLPAVIATRGRKIKSYPYREKKLQFLKHNCGMPNIGDKSFFLGIAEDMAEQSLATIKGLARLEYEEITFEQSVGPMTLVVTDDQPLRRRCLAARNSIVMGKAELRSVLHGFVNDLDTYEAELEEQLKDTAAGAEEQSQGREQEHEDEDEEPQDFVELMLARTRKIKQEEKHVA